MHISFIPNCVVAINLCVNKVSVCCVLVSGGLLICVPQLILSLIPNQPPTRRTPFLPTSSRRSETSIPVIPTLYLKRSKQHLQPLKVSANGCTLWTSMTSEYVHATSAYVHAYACYTYVRTYVCTCICTYIICRTYIRMYILYVQLCMYHF